MMSLPHLVACFLGGAVLANAVPHVVAGLMGRPFQSPFARPSGQGNSSSTVNVLWGFGNLAAGYLLVVRAAAADLHDGADACAIGTGGLLLGLAMARHFGRFNGGNLRDRA